MPGLLRLTIKDANELADLIEQKGGNADSLRAAISDVSNPKNKKSSVPARQLDDEEHIQRLRSLSTIEEGKDLECLICHERFDHLISGTCESCFREWALTTPRREVYRGEKLL